MGLQLGLGKIRIFPQKLYNTGIIQGTIHIINHYINSLIFVLVHFYSIV